MVVNAAIIKKVIGKAVRYFGENIESFDGKRIKLTADATLLANVIIQQAKFTHEEFKKSFLVPALAYHQSKKELIVI